jgi:hypothetical protein
MRSWCYGHGLCIRAVGWRRVRKGYAGLVFAVALGMMGLPTGLGCKRDGPRGPGA